MTYDGKHPAYAQIRRGIGTLLDGKSEGFEDNKLRNETLSGLIPSEKSLYNQLLWFHTKGTLIYVPRRWNQTSPEYDPAVECCCYNYRSFLSTVFGLNRFLTEVFAYNKDKLAEKRKNEIVNAIKLIFSSTNKPIFYGHALDQIDKSIHIRQNINSASAS